MDFAGDADNFRWITWRGGIGGVIPTANTVLVVDRAKTLTGADTDAFVYVGWSMTAGFTVTQSTNNAIILNSAFGGAVGQSGTGWWAPW